MENMQGGNRKHQIFQQCFAKFARKVSMVKFVVRLMISSQSFHVSGKPVSPQECVWKNLYRKTMRTT